MHEPAADLLLLATRCGQSVVWVAREGPRLGRVAAKVSAWSPLQQIDHAALTTTAIADLVERILAGDAACLPAGPRDAKLEFILAAGAIPRGRGDAPKELRAGDDVSAATVVDRLTVAVEKLNALMPRVRDLAAADRRLPHFALGPMTAGEWLRFGVIHFDHHLAIAREADAVSG